MQITFEQLPEVIGAINEKIDRIAEILQHNKLLQKSEADELLTVQQAAVFLKLSVPTLYGFTHNATIPFCKKGKRLYFSKEDLSSWVKTGRHKTKDEIAQDADIFLTQQKKKCSNGK